VIERPCSTLEEAQKAAGAEAANTAGFSVPVVKFRQGTRIFMTGAIPMSWVKSRLETQPAMKRSQMSNTSSSLNRPELPEHSKNIAKYLVENHSKSYIIPPLTLNIQQRANLYTVDYQSDFLPGYLVIPATAKMSITDGQHRRNGVIQALEEMSEEDQSKFGGNALSVMITCETDIRQIHQDFADCSKTKPLPPSLLAVYDTRNPANRLVIDLEESCVLFKGRIDSTSKSLSKKSTFLFLANQVRQLVKELLCGSYAMPDPDFERRAREQLGSDVQYQEVLNRYSEYINHLAKVIPAWAEISRVKPGTLEASQIPAAREEGWICLTATGLNLIGRVGHTLFTKGEQSWKEYADRLGRDIDWRRNASFWQDNIIQGNRVMTQQGPLKLAYDKVRAAIGLGSTKSASETIADSPSA
jgi:DGQHR domain-containing protein